jgi:GNAT superfamily N-acetyltransferase
LQWLRIEVLFVDEAVRGQGIGSRLLLQAEQQARELGAKNVVLETFEFQAPKFYAKHGYSELGRIGDYAKAFYLSAMTKAL